MMFVTKYHKPSEACKILMRLFVSKADANSDAIISMTVQVILEVN
jgi:hypothetical protein